MNKLIPKHVAIIMDGNRRWAKERGFKPFEGHQAGSEALERIVEAASNLGIKTVTVYALSTENLRERGKEEISGIFGIIKHSFRTKLGKMLKNGVRVEIIGELEGLPKIIREIIAKTNKFDVDNEKIKLNVAFNYGGKREIVVAVQKLLKDGVAASEVDEEQIEKRLFYSGDPELVIRTGGKTRLSNFLLWQTAYSELFFSKKMWPDFSEKDLQEAVLWFQDQQRNFGK